MLNTTVGNINVNNVNDYVSTNFYEGDVNYNAVSLSVRLLLPSTLTLTVSRRLCLVDLIMVTPRVCLLAQGPIPIERRVGGELLHPLALVRVVTILEGADRISSTGVATTYQVNVQDQFTSVIRADPSGLSTRRVVILRRVPNLLIHATPKNVRVIVHQALRK